MTPEISQLVLPDIQNSQDNRGIELDRVGITNLVYPVLLLTKGDESLLPVTGTFEVSVRLPASQRGTHMSRLVQVVDENIRTNFGAKKRITLHYLQGVALDVCTRLEAPQSFLKVNFFYFLTKQAPVSNECGLMNYACSFTASCELSAIGPVFGSNMSVEVPVVSLCPCSKEISAYGAHNQRCYVTVTTWTKNPTEFIWIEDVVALVERAASCPVYPILKRPDERHVTMQAYDNPRFVEDIARGVYQELASHARVSKFEVRVVSKESIHNHDAVAEVKGSNA